MSHHSYSITDRRFSFDVYRLPDFPGGSAYYTVWDFFPPAYSCPWDIQRVGRFADGGKWVCGMSKYEEREDKPTIIYSFGVEQDSAFEEAMLERTNAEVFAYDFTVDDVRCSGCCEACCSNIFRRVWLANHNHTSLGCNSGRNIETVHTLVRLG